MTTSKPSRRQPSAAQHTVRTQCLDRVFRATGPVATARRHHRADCQLVATNQPGHCLGYRPDRRIRLRPHDDGAMEGRADGTAEFDRPERPGRPERPEAGRNCPAQIASRSARSRRLKVANGSGSATGATARPARRFRRPGSADPGEAGVTAGSGVAADGSSPSGARISRTRMAGGRRRARSVGAACRHDSRAMRLTVFLRTARRKSRFGTLMTNRGSSLLPCSGSGRGCARLPWRVVVRRP